jgi:pyruvate,orthophosphate dikinase
MIELPRAALTAGEIAEAAEFFSFGTNDLTQTAFGFSRDDIGKFVGMYEERKLVPANPFVTIDRPGVGSLMHRRREGKAANASLHVGIAASTAAILHGRVLPQPGLDYGSCSPFRVETGAIGAVRPWSAESVE